MKGQLAIAYPAEYLGRQQWDLLLDALRAGVNHLGLKEVAFKLDISGSQLSDSLNERDRKGWRNEWTCTLKHMLGERRQLGDEIARDIRAHIREIECSDDNDDEPLTPEEEAMQLRRELLKFGDAGKAAVDRLKKRGRR